ncbi:hypothetical protein BWI97_18330 [Siphonobacter sp. BAB-5405]|uniref:hypothetical protein n=1 Tax=Siphonobacter sp. BAB-5405 TaxID=1864825 RepID=UPI000C80D0E2|nr:hypothetical protein [Siphonobacter sp. BAB-5405]PMD93550.1 hypothetical protein BWI97_18330 [Siphonobacter sp. BAB-5405]
MFSEHDSKTKLGFVRQKRSGLTQEQFEEVLRAFCFLSYFENQFDWESDYLMSKLNEIKKRINSIKFENMLFVEDLKSAIALWIDDNGLVSFAHRSLQEYFAALFVSNLNVLEKERVYTKVIQKFSVPKSVNETENFISLCEEIDTLNYNKYYKLPLFKELRGLLNTNSDYELVKSFLMFFVCEINLPNLVEGDNEVTYATILNLNATLVYRSIYFHIDYTQKIHSLLTRKVYSGYFNKCSSKSKLNSFTSKNKRGKSVVKYIDINGEVPRDFMDEIMQCQEIIEAIRELSDYIDNSIKSCVSYIDETQDLDKGLVDLI